jgi:hypothetical protein
MDHFLYGVLLAEGNSIRGTARIVEIDHIAMLIIVVW